MKYKISLLVLAGLVSIGAILAHTEVKSEDIHSGEASALPRSVVKVTLKADSVILPRGALPLLLTYSFDYGKRVTMNIDPHQVSEAVGLIIEKNGVQITRNAESYAPKLQKVEFVIQDELSTECKIRVLPIGFDLSQPGIYRITYSHPWIEKDDKSEIVFQSNVLLLAVVTSERLQQLEKLLQENKDLAMADYMFKNPPCGIEYPKYKRMGPLHEIEKTLRIGDEREKRSFFFLGHRTTLLREQSRSEVLIGMSLGVMF